MKIVIARHGNTFAPGDVICRIGLRTDIALVQRGRSQALSLGKIIRDMFGSVDSILCGNLLRLKETAQLISSCSETFPEPVVDRRFNELDYGKYDGLPEEQFVQLVGESALQDWDREGKIPACLNIDRTSIISMWRDFALQVAAGKYGETVLVVTSNGTARLAPQIAENYNEFNQKFKLKLATGSFGVLAYSNGAWRVDTWNKC